MDLSPLSALSKLEYLNCNSNRIEKLFDKNHCLVNLKELYLRDNDITDISSLSTMKKLIKLNLNNNPENYFYPKKRGIKGITSIKSLQELKNLTNLDISGNLISKNDIKWLKKRLPKCKIISDY
ncbi:leucine-rich repeat domain-containing protein [Haemophilus parahaemolyticus]